MKKRSRPVLPIIFDSSYLTIYSYPLFMGIAWGVAYYLSVNLFEKNNYKLDHLNQLMIGLFISSWIGAKLFFLWFSSGPKLYQYVYANYFWLGGGFVFYGGLIFGLIFFLIWSLYLKKFEYKQAVYLLPGLCFGHGIGRIGCFFAGCCYGRASNSIISLAINHVNRLPVQLFEAFGLFFIGFYILKSLRENRSNNLIVIYLLSYSLLRFVIEFFRGDDVRGIYWFNLSSSQIVSIILSALVLINLFYVKKFRKIAHK